MASSPEDLIYGMLGQGATAGQSFTNAYQNAQQNQQQAAQQQFQTQLIGAKIAEAQQQQQADARYQSQVADWVKNGAKPEGLVSIAAQNPDKADALQKLWKFKDDDAKQADQTFFGSTYAAADNGRTDLVYDTLKKRRDAELNAGNDTSELDDLLKLHDTDADGFTKQAKAVSLAHLYAADPSKFADAFGIKKGDSYTLSGNDVRYDGDNNVVARGPGKIERPVEVPIFDGDGHRIGTQLVNVGGGGQTSGGPGGNDGSASAGAGRTVGGWTPRQRNGGDNPDDVVDNKIAGIRQALGVAPGTDISSVSPYKIAQALTLSEGGSGSLADRNNNPANLRNGDGTYKKFPTKEAGLAAAAALVSRKLARGQTTVESLVEGLPVGSSSASQAPGYFGPQGGSAAAAAIKPNDLSTVPPSMRAAVQAIAEGRTVPPRPGTRNGEAILDAVTAYDPTFDAANSSSRVKTRINFTSGQAAQNITAMNTAMGHLLHLDDQSHDLGNFSTLPGLLNPIYNTVREKAGNTSLGAFEQTKQAAASELRKVFAGSSGGNLEELRQFEANLSSSKSPEQLHAVIQNAVELLGSRLNALQDQYAQGMGRSDKIPTFIKPSLARQANARFGVDLGGGSVAPKSASAPVFAVNPKTGQRLMLQNGAWVAAH